MNKATVDYFFAHAGDYHFAVYRKCDCDDDQPRRIDDFPLEDLYQAFKARLLSELLEDA